MEVDQQAQEQIDTTNLDLGEEKKQKATETKGPGGSKELLFDEDRLKIYYNRVFPYKLMFKWISYNKLQQRDQKSLVSLEEGIASSYFHNREFSFTLANDVYCRYLCFKTAESFKETLVSRVPFKIDIGAVYNIPPDRHNASDKRAFVPTQKEMVFDIDMNDYDDVRTCCTGANVCQRCWAYLKVAMVVITDILDQDFDFQNLLWVFSGRRGIHAWVCDEGAREMTNEMRSAVVSYCNLGVGNELSGKMTLSHPLHPRLAKVYKYLTGKFQEIIIQDHDLLSIETHRENFLKYLPDEGVRNTVRKLWANMQDTGSEDKWEAYHAEYKKWASQSEAEAKRAKKNFKPDYSLQALIFTYLYPRIDANVSTGINHLLKSPWCIHPKTGKICVPVNAKRPDDFVVHEVPTLTMVINELGSGGGSSEMAKEDGDSLTPDCLRPFMDTFKTFLRNCEKKSLEELKAKNLAKKQKGGDDTVMDF